MNSLKCKVSIIIPTYNSKEYLRECLDSAVNQTLKEIEILVVDASSKDNSVKIAEEYIQKDNRVRLIKRPDEFVGASRNAAMCEAIGDYIMFLDSDDFLELDACELAYNQIKRNDDDVVLFDAYEYFDKNKTKKANFSKLHLFDRKYRSGIPFCFDDIDENFNAGSEPWYKIYKRSFLDKHSIRFGDECFGEDVSFFYRVITCSTSVSILDKKLYNYRKRSTSCCSVCAQSHWKDVFTARRTAYDLIVRSKKESLLKAFLPYYINSIIYWYTRWKKVKGFPKIKYYKQMCCEFYKLMHSHKLLLEQVSSNIQRYDHLKKISKMGYCIHLLQKLGNIFYKKKRKGDKGIIRILGVRFCYNRSKRLYKKLNKRYKAHVKKIHDKLKNNQQIRVAFYVNDGKWKTQKLFDIMKKSKKYHPFVLVGKNAVKSSHSEFQTEEEMNLIIDFYRDKGIEVYNAYDYGEGKFIPLSQFSPDIVFYSRPWCLSEEHSCRRVSAFALTCYVPYFVSNSPNFVECDMEFQNVIWRYYVINKMVRAEYSKTMPNRGKNLRVVGYPLLEYFLDYNPDKYDKTLVIYAPHWSIGDTPLKYATFEWSGKFMLEFAKMHPEVKWVFKPHPILKNRLIKKGFMSEEEVEQYWREWAQISISYEGPDYIDLFKQSRAMITDCGSFLAEYIPTQSPVILLRNKAATPYNVLAKEVTSYYYKVWNLQQLKQQLNKVVLKGVDPWKEERVTTLKELNLVTESSKNILDSLNQDFGIK